MLSEADLKRLRKNFNDKTEKNLTNSFKALSDTNRERIFQILARRAPLSASDIASALKISRPLASQHLKILEQTEIFRCEKRGQNKYYYPNAANPFVKIMSQLIKKSGK